MAKDAVSMKYALGGKCGCSSCRGDVSPRTVAPTGKSKGKKDNNKEKAADNARGVNRGGRRGR